MIVRCPECNSNGKVSDKLSGGKVRCPKCGSSFVAEAVQQREWFYADGDNRIGPVKQDLFVSLLDDGAIVPNTLVWCHGMKGWQPLSEIQSAGNAEECGECHNTFAPTLLQDHNGLKVCESCLLLLRPNTDDATSTTKPGLKYGGLVGRFIAKIIDLAFMLALGLMIEGLSRKLFPGAYASNTLSSVILATFLINILTGVFYLTWFVGKFGATPGKMAFNLKITNPSGGKVGYAHAFGRYCGEYIAALGGISCVTMFAFWGLSYLLPLYPILTGVPGAIMIASVIIYGPALLDPQRRTVYDRFCNTRVLAT